MAASASPAAARRASAWLIAAACLCVAVLLYLRRPDAFLNPQFWSEDGKVFFRDAYYFGARSLLIPYNGYFHAVPRLTALAGTLLPLAAVPAWYNLVALLSPLLVVVYLFSPRLPYDLLTKFLMAAAMVASPLRFEVYLNVTNAQWFLSLGLVLLALAREPVAAWEAVVDSVLLAVVGLTSPFTFLFLPLFLWRVWRRRSRYSLWLLGISILTTAIQLGGVVNRVSNTLVSSYAGNYLMDFARIVGRRMGYVFSGEALVWAGLDSAWAFLPVAVLYAWLAWDAIRQHEDDLVLILGSGAFALVSAFAIRRQDPLTMLDSEHRYFLLPMVTLWWTLLLWRRRRPRVAGLLLGLSLLVSAANYPSPPFVDYHWREASRCLGSPDECIISINPPGWYIKIGPFVPPLVQAEVDATFGDQIELSGYSASQTADQLDLTLVWVAMRRITNNYKYFVHLVDPAQAGQIMAQVDNFPRNFGHPTYQWAEGEIVPESVALSLAGVPPGRYQVMVGWYDPATPGLDRLPAQDARGQPAADDRLALPLDVAIP